MSKRKPRPVPPAVRNAVLATMARAQEVDERRQHQIGNQIGAINRLAAAMHDGEPWTYTDEMSALHQTLAAAQAATDTALERVREMEEELMGKRKDAFMAGFAAGETEDSAEDSWREYKEGLEEETTEDTDDSE